MHINSCSLAQGEEGEGSGFFDVLLVCFFFFNLDSFFSPVPQVTMQCLAGLPGRTEVTREE